MPYGSVGAAPWQSLAPGNTVLIRWRAQPYKEKWVVGRQGTSGAWIAIPGVAGPGGELPVIDGRDATTTSALNFWNEDRGVIKIGGSNSPPDTTPAYIAIENLDIRSGRPPYSFTGRNGLTDYVAKAFRAHRMACSTSAPANSPLRPKPAFVCTDTRTRIPVVLIARSRHGHHGNGFEKATMKGE